jgi:hypothetical protein
MCEKDPYSRQTAALSAKGFHPYRDYFMWGKTPAYRTDDGKHFRFIDRGDVLTPVQLLERLKRDWRPMSADDCTYFEFRMAQELGQLPA